MADDTTTTPGQESANTNGQEPTTTNTSAQTGDGEPFDKDRALATIKNLREYEKLSKAQAKEMEALRQQLKVRADADLSETDKAKARVTELEKANADLAARLQEQAIRGAVADAGAKVGAIRPLLLHRLIDTDDLTFDDDGHPKNVDLVVGNLKRQYPELFRAVAGSADGGSGGQAPPGGPTMDQYIRQKAGIV